MERTAGSAVIDSTVHYDVAILGGGAAGTAAAIELAKHKHSVAVLERSHYENLRIGETVPPQATLWLDRLGVLDAFKAVPNREAPGLVSRWESESTTTEPFCFNDYLHGWHLDRGHFDAMLADAADRAGAHVVRDGVIRSCGKSRDELWQVDVDVKNDRQKILASWLIDATGRNGWFIRRQGVRPRSFDRLVGLLAYIGPRTSADLRLFVEATPTGWWYSAPLPGERSLAALMTDRDLIPHDERARKHFWEAEFAKTHLISDLHDARAVEASLKVVAANSSWAGTVAGSRWLAVGDAAMAHDPLFGLGICQALASGWNAARAVIGFSRGNNQAILQYQAWAESSYRNYMALYTRIYNRVTRWPDAHFWKRRVSQMATNLRQIAH